MTQSQARKLILKYLKKWIPILRLQEWKINVRFLGHGFPHGSGVAVGACAAVHVDWAYLTASIDFDMLQMCEGEEHIEEDVVHELMHIVVAELQPGDDFNPAEERVVTRLARALVSLG